MASTAALGVLTLVAFWSRDAQCWVMLGWRALVAVTIVETIAQGALLVWLSDGDHAP